KLKQVWSTQLSIPVDKYVLSSMTAPVLVAGVQTAQGSKDLLFIHGANDTLFALDANSGQLAWQKSFTNPHKSTAPVRDWLCPKTPNATPTIDKARGIVFFISNDGMLRGLNLADGADRLRLWRDHRQKLDGIYRRDFGPAPRGRRSLARCLRPQCRRRAGLGQAG